MRLALNVKHSLVLTVCRTLNILRLPPVLGRIGVAKKQNGPESRETSEGRCSSIAPTLF